MTVVKHGSMKFVPPTFYTPMLPPMFNPQKHISVNSVIICKYVIQ